VARKKKDKKDADKVLKWAKGEIKKGAKKKKKSKKY
jgi:hypothetical protein